MYRLLIITLSYFRTDSFIFLCYYCLFNQQTIPNKVNQARVQQAIELNIELE